MYTNNGFGLDINSFLRQVAGEASEAGAAARRIIAEYNRTAAAVTTPGYGTGIMDSGPVLILGGLALLLLLSGRTGR